MLKWSFEMHLRGSFGLFGRAEHGGVPQLLDNFHVILRILLPAKMGERFQKRFLALGHMHRPFGHLTLDQIGSHAFPQGLITHWAHRLRIPFTRLRALLRMDGHGMVLDGRDMGHLGRPIDGDTDLFGAVLEGTRALGALSSVFREMGQVEEGRLVYFA